MMKKDHGHDSWIQMVGWADHLSVMELLLRCAVTLGVPFGVLYTLAEVFEWEQ